jgi:hypothetical protein
MVEDSTNREAKLHLQLLESKRNKLLCDVEETWRLRNRAIWIKSGDNNTDFFHNVASHNRNRKHVWEIIDGNGFSITDQGAIKDEAVSYYKKFYKALFIVNTIEQVKVTSLFPRMVSDEETTGQLNSSFSFLT